MYYDLDINVARGARSKALQTLSRLGYDVVAFTTTIADATTISPEHVPPGKSAVDVVGSNAKEQTRFHTNPKLRTKGITVLERVTLVISDPSHLVLLSSSALNEFDLVAVRPMTEKLFQQCLQFDFDIISLCLDRRQLFQVKRPQVHVAAEKGIIFEIQYAAGLRDTNSRRFLIANAGSICRATGGKHLIMSSGAKTEMELRGPHDVMNLGILFDIPQEHSHNAVKKVPEEAVAHGRTRAQTHKGIVRVEKIETEEAAQQLQKMED